MSKKTKIWLIAAASLVLGGCIIIGGAFMMLNWDIAKLTTHNYETAEHKISESYKDIYIVSDTADIKLVTSENTDTSVICYEQKNLKHTVAVKDGTLTIEIVDNRKWYENIGINFGSPKITVYVPQGEYGAFCVKSSTGDVEIPAEFKFESIDISQSTGDVVSYASVTDTIKIKTSTGNIRLENISAGDLDLSVSTGRVTASGVNCVGEVKVGVTTGKTYISDVKCSSLSSSGDTGDISLKNVIAAESFFIMRSTGDVAFEMCDASNIFVQTDTGDVSGSLLSEKVFMPQSDTGKIDVPKTMNGGKCEIITDTGDIKMRVSYQ